MYGKLFFSLTITLRFTGSHFERSSFSQVVDVSRIHREGIHLFVLHSENKQKDLLILNTLTV